MINRLFKTSTLTISARPPDLQHLPLTLQSGGGIGGGLFMMVFAAVWGGVPGYFVLSQLDSLEGGAFIALLFPLIGLALFVFGFLSMFRRRRVTIDDKGVGVEVRRFRRWQGWREPLAHYRGVLLKQVTIRRNKSSYTAHAVFLAHRDDDKSVPLFVARDRQQARRTWEQAAKALRLAAIEQTDDGEVTRALEDLDKSVRELAAEGRLKVDFAARPPPAGLSAHYDGEVLVVETDRPSLPLPGMRGPAPAHVVLILVVVLLIGLSLFFFVLPLALVLGAVAVWRFLGRDRLFISRDGVALQRIGRFGESAPRRIAADAVEEVRVAGGRGWLAHLEIVSDEAILRFARGRSAEALEWAREAVLAHVAGGGPAPSGDA